MNTEPLAVSIPEAMRLTSLGRSTLYRLIAKQKLKPVKIGMRTLLRTEDLKKLVGVEETRS